MQSWVNVRTMKHHFSPYAHIRVLLVEDEPLIGLDCDAILREIGVRHVVLVTSLAEAEKAIAEQSFDAALLDVRLGGGTTLEFAGRLAAHGIAAGFISGYRQEDLPETMKSLPFVAKPFTSSQIGGLLEGLLGEGMYKGTLAG